MLIGEGEFKSDMKEQSSHLSDFLFWFEVEVVEPLVEVTLGFAWQEVALWSLDLHRVHMICVYRHCILMHPLLVLKLLHISTPLCITLFLPSLSIVLTVVIHVVSLLIIICIIKMLLYRTKFGIMRDFTTQTTRFGFNPWRYQLKKISIPHWSLYL